MLVFHDVGERVRLDNLLKDMQTTARIGGWEYDVETHKIHWTEALYAIHDLPFGQPIELDASRNMFHPEDRKKLHRGVAARDRHRQPAATCTCA